MSQYLVYTDILLILSLSTICDVDIAMHSATFYFRLKYSLVILFYIFSDVSSASQILIFVVVSHTIIVGKEQFLHLGLTWLVVMEWNIISKVMELRMQWNLMYLSLHYHVWLHEL